MRQIIIIAIGLFILMAGFATCKWMSSFKTYPEPKERPIVAKAVKSQIIEIDGAVPKTEIFGTITSRDKIEVYAEVSGRLLSQGIQFREGNSFSRGAALIQIDSRDQRLAVQSQRSQFMSLFTSALSDIKIDFPDELTKWETYIRSIDPEKNLPQLPETKSQREKFFIVNRNIPNTYYSIKSAEARLAKYSISAPFYGVVSESNINPGTLVRAGQKLGEFINQNNFEVESAVNIADLDAIKIGDKVSFTHPETEEELEGKIIRIADLIDSATQSAKVYSKIEGEELRDGISLSGVIYSDEVQGAVSIDRRLLVDGNSIFIIENGVLEKLKIDILKEGETQVLVAGLANGTKILSEPINNAYAGLAVKEIEQ